MCLPIPPFALTADVGSVRVSDIPHGIVRLKLGVFEGDAVGSFHMAKK